uniref:Uncharacterized protein n=1 Tax=Megaselia scalaris TaxID=36166 RepID=T1GG25_MEGSC
MDSIRFILARSSFLQIVHQIKGFWQLELLSINPRVYLAFSIKIQSYKRSVFCPFRGSEETGDLSCHCRNYFLNPESGNNQNSVAISLYTDFSDGNTKQSLMSRYTGSHIRCRPDPLAHKKRCLFRSTGSNIR